MKRNEAVITFMTQKAKVVCDRRCDKAWGINTRPKVLLSEDEDDYAYFADGELEKAPKDPGTYEGGHAKPSSSDEFPNKWCVRECERCNMSFPGKADEPLELKSFSERQYNIPDMHTE